MLWQTVGGSNRPLSIGSNVLFQPAGNTNFLYSVSVSNALSNLGNASFSSNVVVAASLATTSLNNTNFFSNLGSIYIAGAQSNASSLSVAQNVAIGSTLSNAGNLDCASTVCGHVGLTLGVQGKNGINIYPPATTSLYTLTLPPSIPSSYYQHIGYPSNGIGAAFITAFLSAYWNGIQGNYLISFGTAVTNASGICVYNNTTNNVSTGTSCTPNNIVSIHANAIYSGGMVNCTIQSVSSSKQTVTAQVALMNATTGLYNSAAYSVVNGCTVYFTVVGY